MVKHLAGNQVLGALNQRYVNIDQIRLLQQLLQVFHLNKAALHGFLRGDKGVVAKDMTAKAIFQDIRNALTDVAHSNLAQRFAAQLRSNEGAWTNFVVGALSAICIGFYNSPCEGKEKSDCHLCHGVGICGRRKDDPYSPLPRGSYINSVDANAMLSNDLKLFCAVHHFGSYRNVAQNNCVDFRYPVKIIHNLNMFA